MRFRLCRLSFRHRASLGRGPPVQANPRADVLRLCSRSLKQVASRLPRGRKCVFCSPAWGHRFARLLPMILGVH
eukprot:12926600-Prorocentrum_lima.AAC.1